MTLSTSTMIYILLGLIVLLALWIIYLEIRIKKLLMGKNGKSLEDSILSLKDGWNDYSQFKKDSIEYLKNIEARLKRSLQAVETVRFNPFKGTGSGGNQSFATAFINEKGDGVVISSLYSREHISVFSKPLKKFQSEFETSQEERSAISNAKETLVNREK
jgi:hypothetical protein